MRNPFAGWLDHFRQRKVTRQLRKEIAAALYTSDGCMLILVRLDATRTPRVSSYTCGTGKRHFDRAIVKAFSHEYLRTARDGGERDRGAFDAR